MSTGQDISAADVENTRVFDYRQEVIVELHGHTPDGEFEAVSYVFRVEADDGGLRSPEIAAAHEEVVREALSETDYSLG